MTVMCPNGVAAVAMAAMSGEGPPPTVARTPNKAIARNCRSWASSWGERSNSLSAPDVQVDTVILRVGLMHRRDVFDE